MDDYGTKQISAVEFFSIPDKRDIQSAMRLCSQFETSNRATLSYMNCQILPWFEGNQIYVKVIAGNMVGAVPLRSPTQATLDFGLVVRPRFAWAGIGPMLSQMGWNTVPKPLKLPNMRTSERQVPPWVLSSMVLHRIHRLLDSLNRKFEMKMEILTSPRGSVMWNDYAIRHVSKGDYLSVPCIFSELTEDVHLRGAIRFTLESHLTSLESQRTQGQFVVKLMSLCTDLLHRVRDVPTRIPSPKTISSWSKQSLRSQAVFEGIEAMEWTLDERGLAGTSDLNGLPWAMPMEEFYESWVETVFRIVARQCSATLKTGKKRETVRPIAWQPAYSGTQKSLIPDLWMEREGLTVIVDAKYKRHWEDLKETRWQDVDAEIRERHRADIMQTLAYANLSKTARTITCLAYPCSCENWAEMRERNRVIHRATLDVGERQLELWLIAVPMAVSASEIAAYMANAINAEALQ